MTSLNLGLCFKGKIIHESQTVTKEFLSFLGKQKPFEVDLNLLYSMTKALKMYVCFCYCILSIDFGALNLKLTLSCFLIETHKIKIFPPWKFELLTY